MSHELRTPMNAINVSDTGQGIAPKDLPRLFVAFERLNAARLGVDGAGLGLALSKRLVELMGGGIGADSVAGEGSVFWVELPLAADPATELKDVEPRLPRPAEELSAAGGTVLYIEDNLSNVKLVERAFRWCPELPGQAAGRARIVPRPGRSTRRCSSRCLSSAVSRTLSATLAQEGHADRHHTNGRRSQCLRIL